MNGRDIFKIIEHSLVMNDVSWLSKIRYEGHYMVSMFLTRWHLSLEIFISGKTCVSLCLPCIHINTYFSNLNYSKN